MNQATYRKSIEKLIGEQQTVQMNNPPSSQQWQRASAELHRLASLINPDDYETRVQQLENDGLTRSDAQAVVDAEVQS